MENNVFWKMPGLFKGADAQKCYEEMGSENVTAEEVLAKAKNPNSELHKCFEWDDSVAAEQYRLQQASLVIRQLVIIPIKENATPTRVFQISSEKKVYQPVSVFVHNDDEYQVLLQRARNELEAFTKRYRQIVELEEIFDAIETFLK